MWGGPRLYICVCQLQVNLIVNHKLQLQHEEQTCVHLSHTPGQFLYFIVMLHYSDVLLLNSDIAGKLGNLYIVYVYCMYIRVYGNLVNLGRSLQQIETMQKHLSKNEIENNDFFWVPEVGSSADRSYVLIELFVGGVLSTGGRGTVSGTGGGRGTVSWTGGGRGTVSGTGGGMQLLIIIKDPYS